MNLSDRAIDHPRIVIVFTLLVILLAVTAAIMIPIQRTPAIHTAFVTVAIPYPGAEPTEVEDQITRKVERALQQLDRVDFVVSSSQRGASVILIVFLDGVDAIEARNEVEHLVNEVRRELPAGREVQPIVREVDFEGEALMLVTLTGPAGVDERSLKQIAEDVQDELEALPGVSNTNLFGGREREIHVNANPDLLAQYGLTLADLWRAIGAFHAPLPGGSLNSSVFDPQIRTETRFRTVDDIRQAVVRQEQGRLVLVEDVAEVIDTYRRRQNIAEFDGRPSATIIVNKEADINTLGTAFNVQARIAELQAQYPHIQFACTQDTSDEIKQMFQTLGADAIFGAMVVMVILAWTMGFRISLLVTLAIPFSSAVALVFLFVAGYAISNMVIFSFIVALGMVVDGAIIVADAIYRRLEAGESPKEAAKNGVHEVAMPVFAADMVTIAAFLPMLFIPGIMGDFMGMMPIVVCMALCGSLIVDHFLVPTVAAWWFQGFVPSRSAAGGGSAGRVERLWAPFFHSYEFLLRGALHHRWLVVAGCLAAIGWAYGMIALGFIGTQFFPQSDRGQFVISFELPLGYSIDEAAKAAETIAAPLRELQKSGEVVHFVSTIGTSPGMTNGPEGDQASGPEFGSVNVELSNSNSGRRHQNEIIDDLRARIRPVPGMTYRIDSVQEGPPGGADVAVQFSGKNLAQIGDLGKTLVKRLSARSDTLDVRSDFRPDNPELVVEPKDDVVGLFGMTDSDVARNVQMAILGDSSIQLPLDDEDITLRVQVDPKYQQDEQSMLRLPMVSPDGRRTTVGQLIDLRRHEGLFAVNRRDYRRSVTVYSGVVNEGDQKKSLAIQAVRDELTKKILPELGFAPAHGNALAFVGKPNTPAEGCHAEFKGVAEEQAEGFFYLLCTFLVGVVLILLILIVQFNSFRQALVVMSTVPLAFVGVVLGMLICNFPFSLSSFIGLVSLTGVVVNDSIVLVDFINDARRRGMPLYESVVEGGTKRARAVILTMLTSVGGTLPTFFNLTGGGEFWQPLTGAIIFGLALSACLTLFVIPVNYSLAYSWAERNRLRRLAADEAREAAEAAGNGQPHFDLPAAPSTLAGSP